MSLKNIKIKKIDPNIAKKNYNPHLKILRRNQSAITYENIVLATDADVDRPCGASLYFI